MVRLILLLCLAGCATTRVPRPTSVGGLSVVWEDAVTQEEYSQSLYAVKFIASRFFYLHRVKPDYLTVSIVPLPRLRIERGLASGVYYRKKRLIRVILGRWNTLPSFYHELCHAYFAPIDVDHENPNWEVWQQTAQELNTDLLEEALFD